MPTPNQTVQQINELIGYLVESLLADALNVAIQLEMGGSVQVTFAGAEHVSIALRDRPYGEIYERLLQERAYNVHMPGGALIQMMYKFRDDALLGHRLAFFPAPDLEEFQNNPEIYGDDEVYADLVARNIVPFPIRFDYDVRDDQHIGVAHPKSHLTFGQYKNCRILVTAPLTPFRFVEFILRNFYHTAFERYAENFPRPRGGVFSESISRAEREVIHVVVPV